MEHLKGLLWLQRRIISFVSSSENSDMGNARQNSHLKESLIDLNVVAVVVFCFVDVETSKNGRNNQPHLFKKIKKYICKGNARVRFFSQNRLLRISLRRLCHKKSIRLTTRVGGKQNNLPSTKAVSQNTVVVVQFPVLIKKIAPVWRRMDPNK